jgi:GNAT superfamily N-acetyltransferase
MLTASDATVLVAKRDARILGLAEVYLRRDEEHAAVVAHAYGYLQSLMVVADMRRRGIGTLLLHAAERWAAERGARELRLETWEFAGGPSPFYEARGYRTLRRTWVRAL